jgi:hypothetical protein
MFRQLSASITGFLFRCATLKYTSWRRVTEQRVGSAKSVFHFDVQGSVAKSTHAGIPWLLYLRRQLGARLHFWPFDGWSIPERKSAVVVRRAS